MGGINVATLGPKLNLTSYRGLIWSSGAAHFIPLHPGLVQRVLESRESLPFFPGHRYPPSLCVDWPSVYLNIGYRVRFV